MKPLIIEREKVEELVQQIIAKLPTPKAEFKALAKQLNVSPIDLRITGEHLEELILELSKVDAVCDLCDGRILNSGQGGIAIRIEDIARWIVSVSHVLPIDSILQKLESFLCFDYMPVIQTIAISGLSPREEIQITEDITLIPFESLPSSYGKEALSPSYLQPEFLLKIGLTPQHRQIGYRPPKAALVRNLKLRPKLYSSKDIAKHGADFLPFYELCEFLVLFKEATPLYVAGWCDTSDEVPFKSLLGEGYSAPIIDSLSRTEVAITQKDWDELAPLYQKFVQLPQNVRDLLRVPIQRINQSRRRVNLADKAIDLGVACEALMLNDKSHKEQISFTLRLRASLFLASSYEERETLMHFFSAFYSCRSIAAHTGKLDSKVKIPFRGKIKPSMILEEGDRYCVDAIIKIINLGHFPDWNRLLLANSYDTAG